MEGSAHEFLIDVVSGMLNSYFHTENMYKPRLLKNQYLSGKKMRSYVDIYFEFIQMNNIERTVVNVVAEREVTTNDILNLHNILEDLDFKANGVIYYDFGISKEALKVAEHRIKTVKFNFQEEVLKSVKKRIGQMLPDESVIGDPFWIVMDVNETDNNSGNYAAVGTFIPLFLSYKQAKEFADTRDKSKVYGLGQQHLSILVNQADMMKAKLALIQPSYGTLKLNDSTHGLVAPGNDNILKWYFRGE